MADIFLPTLHTFAMKNEFTGSCGELRFKIVPNVVKSETNPKEVDMVLNALTNPPAFDPGTSTRGLYLRGID